MGFRWCPWPRLSQLQKPGNNNMIRSKETGPSTAQGGSKISQDPASGVPVDGALGGRATSTPHSSVVHQADGGCNATGGTAEEEADDLTGAVGGSKEQTTASGSEVDSEAPNSTPLEKRKKKRMSGGMRRKLLRQRAKKAEEGGAKGDSGASQNATETPSANPSEEAEPKTSGKRPRQSSTPAASGTMRAKVSKPDGVRQGLSFKVAADRALRVQITDSEKPERVLSEDEVDLLQQKLLEALDAHPNTGPELKVAKSGMMQGMYIMTCADQATKEWLENAVLELPPLEVDGHTVKFGTQDPSKRTKVSVYIPSPRSTTVADTAVILQRLQKQNRSALNTQLWTVHARVTAPKGVRLILGVDDSSLAGLKRLDWQPYFEFTRVMFSPEGARR